MLAEINVAASFIINLVARQPRHDELTEESIAVFSKVLISNMEESFVKTWRPELPNYGSANRCIRINFGMIDSTILDAAKAAGIAGIISQILPKEFCMWVDPLEVSYRLNDRSPPYAIYDGRPVATSPTSATSADRASRIPSASPSLLVEPTVVHAM